jgi:hypothetical protein
MERMELLGAGSLLNFVSVVRFLRDMSPDDRDMWWEGQTQAKSQRAH